MKTFSFQVDPLTGEQYYEVYVRGRQLMNDPLLNKLSAFTREERLSLELDGLLRSSVSTIESQMERSLEMFRRKQDDLDRYIFLQSLLDRSEVLFYRTLVENLEEMVPIVYTPTVGQACLQMSHIMRRYRGITLTRDNIAHIDRIFQNISRPHINLIVVTDGERILGLGDLGSDGMGIPVGKVNLYVAAGGLHPACALPICLDIGTNNARLQNDPLYLGDPRPRLEGDAYFEFIERFVLGVKEAFPNALLQWEDFAKHKAFPILHRYRDRLPSFNDDIQGTGAVALSALMTAMRIKRSSFQEQRFLIIGMGQAGSGIAANIREALIHEGLGPEEARQRLFCVDQPGLLVDDMSNLDEPQKLFAQSRAAVAGWRLDSPGAITLADVVRNAKPTVLIGVTAQPKLFGDEILAAMAKNAERPVIMALSNPTSRCECSILDVAKATQGRGLMAVGSPFPPEQFAGKRLVASQCNNLYIFPGMGLGALVSRTQRVTAGMFLAASRAISAMVDREQEERGLLLPEMSQIREVSARVATAVALEAKEQGLGRLVDDEGLERLVRRAQWYPAYSAYRPGPPQGGPVGQGGKVI